MVHQSWLLAFFLLGERSDTGTFREDTAGEPPGSGPSLGLQGGFLGKGLEQRRQVPSPPPLLAGADLASFTT